MPRAWWVLAAGEPGIGKTRLLAELDARGAARGWLVLAGRGTAAERAVPYGLVIDALDWVSALVTGLAPVIAFLISLFDNDHLNDQTFVFTRQVLEDRLAKAGSSFDITRRFVGGSADYSLTIRVSRTA